MSAQARDALAAAGALGPFCVLEDIPGPDWVSWAEVVDRPEPFGRRVDDSRELLAAGPGAPDVPVRVVASVVHLGLVARLVSPPLGAALMSRVLPVLPAGSVHLHPVGSNPVPMAFDHPAGVPVLRPAEVAASLDRHWLDPLAAPLTAAVGRWYGLSAHVLVGNVASAVAGALRTIAAARPQLSAAAVTVLEALLAEGSLAGRGRRRPDGAFVRRSCCLWYRLPGAGTCGDCVLDVRAETDDRPSV
jgi:hypothetical protein